MADSGPGRPGRLYPRLPKGYNPRGMRRAIINADDFGLCRGVNEGIIKAHREGVLTSATLMANMPGFDHAVGLAKDNPGLGVGIHLNMVVAFPPGYVLVEPGASPTVRPLSSRRMCNWTSRE